MTGYQDYKETGLSWLGRIPNHWKRTRLGFLVDTIVPMRDKPKNLNGPIPWIRIEDLDGRYIESSKSGQGVSKSTIEEMNLKVFPIRTVLCTCSCSFGRSMIVKQPLLSNQTFIGLLPDEHRLTSEFLSFYLESSSVELENRSSGSIQKYLSRDSFKSFPISVPPVSEQHQIVSFLDEKTSQIDDLIEKKKRKIELLKEYRSSLISHVVTKGLDPNVEMKDSGVEWIGEIPSHWDTPQMRYLVGIKSGKGISTDQVDTDGQFPVYGGNGVMGYTNSSNCSGGVLSVGRVGEKCGVVHRVEEECWISDNSLVLTPINDENTNLKFLEWSLRSRDLNSIRSQTTQPLITGSQVKNEGIPLPPVPEQHQIVSFLDDQTSQIDSSISIEEKSTKLLQEYRQSLISEVVTGKIKVTD